MLPLEAARELVPLASRLSVETSAGSACTAARAAASLRDATIGAINRGLVPPRLQEELLAEANALADAVPCRRGGEPSDAARDRAWRLSGRVGALARRGLARRHGPLDLRVPRAVVPPAEPQYAVELLHLVPEARAGEATPGQRAVWVLDTLFAEVANGGFAQFFANDPELADDIVPSARTIGVEPYVALVREALSARDRPARLARLDSRMYELWEKPGLAPAQLFRAYVEAHPDEFFVEA